MSDEPIERLAWRGDLESLTERILLGADPDEKTEEGHTPLHSAIENSHVEVVRFLLESGADPDLEGRWTPVFHAIEVEADAAQQLGPPAPSTTILRLLLEHGADPNQVVSSPPVNMEWCRTALQLAHHLNYRAAELLLLEFGAK